MESVFITIKQLVMSLNRKNPVLSAIKSPYHQIGAFVLSGAFLSRTEPVFENLSLLLQSK